MARPLLPYRDRRRSDRSGNDTPRVAARRIPAPRAASPRQQVKTRQQDIATWLQRAFHARLGEPLAAHRSQPAEPWR